VPSDYAQQLIKKELKEKSMAASTSKQTRTKYPTGIFDTQYMIIGFSWVKSETLFS